MAAVSQMRQESLEKAILFMQQEHASTLKGLHEEIQKLQKRCSELTFQLALETTSSPQEDLLREKAEQIEKELISTTTKLTEKEHEVETKGKRIDDLELKLKAQEKSYKDKICYLNKLVSKYKRQAEESAAQNADLLFQNHRQNVVRASVDSFSVKGTSEPNPSENKTTSSASSPRSHDLSPRTKISPKIKPALHPHAPKEPREGRPTSSSGKYRQRTARHGSFEVPEGHPVLRPADGRRYSDQGDEIVPDPRPFLQVTRQQQQAMCKSAELRRQQSKPLPPITKSVILESYHQETSSADVCSPKPPSTRRSPSSVPTPNKADSANFKKLKERAKGSPQALEVELQTLAIDDITKSSVSNLRKAQEYGSD